MEDDEICEHCGKPYDEPNDSCDEQVTAKAVEDYVARRDAMGDSYRFMTVDEMMYALKEEDKE